MSTTSPALVPTLNLLEGVPDPTADGGNPAATVQLQNSSPFILEVLVGGLSYTIQSFTAQTLPTGGTGAGLTIVPTTGPAGPQGSITAVWLLNGEAPPMADGQLTGAAQYAEGLGSTLGTLNNPNFLSNAGAKVNVELTPTTRTLIVQFAWTMNVVGFEYPSINVTGDLSHFAYYSQLPYLESVFIVPPNETSHGMIVCRVNPLLDPSVTVEFVGGTANAASVTATILGDTAAFLESDFYNGAPVPTSVVRAAAGNSNVLTGPFRVLSVLVQGSGGASANLLMDGVAIAHGAVNGVTPLALDDPVLVYPGVTINLSQLGTGTSAADLLTAFP